MTPARTPSDAEPITAVCDGGHRWSIMPASLGEPCDGCGCPLRRPDAVDAALAEGVVPSETGWAVRVSSSGMWARKPTWG